jgi:Dipeptidyl peptidase IV (DPP IV) N-terminal region
MCGPDRAVDYDETFAGKRTRQVFLRRCSADRPESETAKGWRAFVTVDDEVEGDPGGRSRPLRRRHWPGCGTARPHAAPKGQLPDWSPDGTKIAYQSTAAGNGDIYVMNANGSNQTQLTKTPENEFGTAWSPNGDEIAFVRVHGPTAVERAIYVMNADGSGQHFVHQGSRVPAWQPLGKRIH